MERKKKKIKTLAWRTFMRGCRKIAWCGEEHFYFVEFSGVQSGCPQ